MKGSGQFCRSTFARSLCVTKEGSRKVNQFQKWRNLQQKVYAIVGLREIHELTVAHPDLELRGGGGGRS